MDNVLEKNQTSAKTSKEQFSITDDFPIHINRTGPSYVSEQSSIIDENVINNSRLDKLKNEFSQNLIDHLFEVDFEYGIDNQADVIVREQMSFNCIATKSWLNSLFVDNFNNADILIGILRLIARIDYLSISPEGTIMALAALAHSNMQVKECGIRAFESWCSIESLKVLENLTVQPAWLQDYANRVVSDLREELNVTSC